MKGQISFPAKVAVTVISVTAFMLVIFYYASFVSTVKEEKAKAEFRAEVLSVLQKLVNSEKCLAYSGLVKSSKPVLDKKKIEEFVSKYKDIEPDCAKALDFDYSVKIIQLPKDIKTYPGEAVKQVECGEVTGYGIAVHGYGKDELTIFFVCESDLRGHCSEEVDCNGGWGDRSCPYIPGHGYYISTDHPLNFNGVLCYPYNCSEFIVQKIRCSFGSCSVEDDEKCMKLAMKGEKVCCIHTNCLQSGGSDYHPYFLKCYNLDPERECKPVSMVSVNAYCGAISVPVRVPATTSHEISLNQKVWSFSVSSGITSFSPQKAKWDEMEISYPVVIRYNETFSTEGVIKIKAVRGELEKFVGILEDICKKAERGENVYFADEFSFSYSVKRYGNRICMLDKCKIFDCPIPLEMKEIKKGEYYLRIIYHPSEGKIRVIE